jgi:hypothetical protein
LMETIGEEKMQNRGLWEWGNIFSFMIIHQM